MVEIARIKKEGIKNNRDIMAQLATCEWFANQTTFAIHEYLRYAQQNNLLVEDGECLVLFHNCD